MNYDLHADREANPKIRYHEYKKGQALRSDEGALIAAFEGEHGWYWRNRTDALITVTLRASGQLQRLERGEVTGLRATDPEITEGCAHAKPRERVASAAMLARTMSVSSSHGPRIGSVGRRVEYIAHHLAKARVAADDVYRSPLEMARHFSHQLLSQHYRNYRLAKAPTQMVYACRAGCSGDQHDRLTSMTACASARFEAASAAASCSRNTPVGSMP